MLRVRIHLTTLSGIDKRVQAGLRDAECDGTIEDAVDTASKEIGVRNEYVPSSLIRQVMLTLSLEILASPRALMMSTSDSYRLESRRSAAHCASGT